MQNAETVLSVNQARGQRQAIAELNLLGREDMKYYGAVQLRHDDDSWLKEYATHVTPLVKKYGGKYLARTKTMEKVEGDRELPSLFVIIEWPSKQAFDDFYSDPEYQKHKKLRHDNSKDELIMLAGEDIAAA